MKFRTAAALFLGILNALWLTHVFVVLAIYGSYPITEPVRWIALFELVFCLAVAGLGIERLARLRENR